MSAEHGQSPYPSNHNDLPPGPPQPVGPHDVDTTVPEPVLLNCWKHHAREIRERIRAHVVRGEAGLFELASRLNLVGTRITDLYVGGLTPAHVAEQSVAWLHDHERLAPDAFRTFVDQQAGYQMIELADGSRWCLRWGTVAGRHVHLHPGRYSPLTLRVRASLLKTVVVTLALAEFDQRDPMSVNVVNEARARFLNLGPVQALQPGESLGGVLRAILDVA